MQPSSQGSCKTSCGHPEPARQSWRPAPCRTHAAWLLTELRQSQASPATPYAGGSVSSAAHGRRLADPTTLAALVTPALPLAQVPASLCGLAFRMTRFYGNGPVAVLGRWGGVHKTTIRCWV